KADAKAGDEAWQGMFDARLLPAMDAYLKSIHDITDRQTELFKQSSEMVQEVFQSGRVLLVALGVIALALGAVLAFLLARSITRPLSYAVSVARTVSSG